MLLLQIVLLIFSLLFLLNLGIYLFQHKLIFQAVSLDKDEAFEFEGDWEEYYIPVDEGVELNAVYFKTSDISKGLILYFHGNADNLKRWGQYAVDFTSQGFDVLMMDYRSYGKSNGRPEEKLMYSDSKKVYDWVHKELTFNTLVIYGRSLGTAPASWLSTQHEPAILFLETPFNNIQGTFIKTVRRLIFPSLLQFQFPNENFIQKVSAKIVIFQGTWDWVVPFRSALLLKKHLKGEDKFVTIERGSHKNLRKYPLYHEELSKALAGL